MADEISMEQKIAKIQSRNLLHRGRESREIKRNTLAYRSYASSPLAFSLSLQPQLQIFLFQQKFVCPYGTAPQRPHMNPQTERMQSLEVHCTGKNRASF